MYLCLYVRLRADAYTFPGYHRCQIAYSELLRSSHLFVLAAEVMALTLILTLILTLALALTLTLDLTLTLALTLTPTR